MFKRIIIPVLAALAVAMAFTACEPENNVTPYEWDVTARLAKHSDGETADHGNWEAVGSVEISGNVISIEADESRMEEYLSTDPGQQDKAHKWFAILIGTGEDDIKKVTYNGNPLTEKDVSERNDMLGKDGSAAASDEFVLWLTTENANGYRFILGHENAESLPVSIIYRNTAAPEAEELPEASVALVNDIMKAAFASFDTLETGTEAFTSGGYEGTAELTVMESSWTLHVTADIEGTKDAAAGHDVEFTVTSGDMEEGNDILVTIAGKEYKASAEAISSGVEVPERPVEEFRWDIWFHGAKHSRGDAEDHGNWKQIKRVFWKSNENPISLDIEANLGYMTEFESTDPNQGVGKWFPIMIQTGETDITKVKYNGEYLADKDIADRDDIIVIENGEDREAANDEFVLWLNATALLEEGKTITLGHEGAEDVVVNITLTDVTPDAMPDDDKTALKTYILGFGHDRTILDLDKILRGETVDGIYSHRFWDSDEGISMSISFGDAYDYDGDNGSKTVNGYLNILFTGEMDDKGRFQASGYEMSTGYAAGSYVGFAGGDKELYLIQISDTDPIKGSFASKATPDGIPLNLTFIMDGDTPVGIEEEDLKVVKFQAPVSGEVTSLGSEPEQITDIIGDVSVFEDAVAGFNEDDLINGFLPYAMNPAHEATFGRLSDVKAETTTSRPGFYVNSTAYNAETGILTFDLTWDGYAYNGSSSSHSALSGDVTMIFTGTEENGVLKADTWAFKGENLTVNGSDGSVSIIDEIDISGPVFSSSPRPAATNGAAATADFIIEDGQYTMTMSDKTACAFGLLDLSGYMVIDGGKISAEMVNVLMDSYAGLI